MLHGEQIGHREPNLRPQQLGERLGWVRVMLLLQHVRTDRRVHLWVGPDFHFFVIHVHRTKVFGQPFVEPSLSRRIVGVQQHVGKIMSHGPPRVFLKNIQHKKVLIFARKKKTWHANRLAIF